MRPVLLFTYPVDLGSAALAGNLEAMLKGRVDVDHRVFSPSEVPDVSMTLGVFDKAKRRISSMPEVARACAKARKEGRVVLFQATGAALFSMPYTRGLKTFVALDWTRKLFEPILGRPQSNALLTMLHGRMFRSRTGLLPFTGPVRDCLVMEYGVDPRRAVKVPMPFDVDGVVHSRPNPSGPLRVLFVGGDFERKGGEDLVRWFVARSDADRRDRRVEVTVMTQSDVDLPSEIRLLRNDPSRTAKDAFPDYDVFVLPTKRDAFPLAIGEAASGGLAVVTTSTAFGCREVVEEGVNGHVVEGYPGLCHVLDGLVGDRERVERYKSASLRIMRSRFSYAAAFRDFEDAMESTSEIEAMSNRDVRMESA